jgi:hypothetical protein
MILNHRNIIKIINIITISILILTSSIIGCYSGPIFKLNIFLIPTEFNITGLLILLIGLYYCLINVFKGIVLSFILFFYQFISYYIYILFPDIWLVALIMHIFCWLIKISFNLILKNNNYSIKKNK